MRGIKLAEDFIESSRAVGYEISHSVFKADFNGKSWTVGFWIRPAKLNKDHEYDLPGRCGKAKHTSFNRAVEAAIKKALRLEQM